MEEIKKHSGSQFDPVVVESAMTMLVREFVGKQPASEQTDTQIRVSQKFALQIQST
jgi:HD-GYP domain-containing protein (c-di-GMP phosphodiesterase class II)